MKINSESRGEDSNYQSADDCVLVDELAHEFAERLRKGERVTIADYAERYPRLADDIKELFPTIVTMEQLTRSKKNATAKQQGLNVEQLGDYRIMGEIARGGMGIVYEAEQVSLGRRVAMKVLPAQSLRSKNELLRFQREARTAARLHHTNVVPVFGVGEQDGYHYIVMQYIEGVGLDEVLSELRSLVLDQSPQETDATSARSSYAKHNAKSLLTNQFTTNAAGDYTRQDPPRTDIHQPNVSTASNVAADSTATSTEFAAVDVTAEATAEPTAPPVEHYSKNAPLGYESLPGKYWRSVADIGVQASEALAYAHSARTLHRDVKPGNLLLDIHGNVWIADFGLAKAIEAENVTWTGDIVGTLSYMAPERFRDETDARSDIYGLGLTLYELLTLKRAFDGSERASLMHRVANDPIQPPRKLNPQIPRDLETIVLKATAKDPSDRYQTASEMADDLRCFIADAPIAARRTGPIERLSRWCRRNKTVAVLTASVATLLIVSSTLATVGYLRETTYRRHAESTSQLAFDVFDRLYDQLAPDMDVPQNLTQSYSGTGREPQESDVPLSTEAAAALASLLEFYDKLSTQSSNSANS
ncbi:serine/threonine protein kinase, partial [Planctomycetota bacterium]